MKTKSAKEKVLYNAYGLWHGEGQTADCQSERFKVW